MKVFEKHFAVVATVCAVLAIICLVWMSGSLTGAMTYYEHRDNPHVTFSENLCREGETPTLVQETRWGTGKNVQVNCVRMGTIIRTDSVPFPPIRQRHRQPGIRYSY